ncbi:unnamed protein product [Absidia cylindrospora]
MPFSHLSIVDGNSGASRSSSRIRTPLSNDHRHHLRLEDGLDLYVVTSTKNRHENNTNRYNIYDKKRKQYRDGHGSVYSKRKHASSIRIPTSDHPKFTSMPSKQIKRLNLSSSSPSLFQDTGSVYSKRKHVSSTRIPTSKDPRFTSMPSKQIKRLDLSSSPPSLFQDNGSVYSKGKHASSTRIPTSDGPGFTSTPSKQIKRLDLSSSPPSLFQDNGPVYSKRKHASSIRIHPSDRPGFTVAPSKQIKRFDLSSSPPSLFQDNGLVYSKREHTSSTRIPTSDRPGFTSTPSKQIIRLDLSSPSLFQDNDSFYSKRKHASSIPIPKSDDAGFTSTPSKQIKRFDLSLPPSVLIQDNDSGDSPTASKRIKPYLDFTKPGPSLNQDGESIEDYLNRTTTVPNQSEHQDGLSGPTPSLHQGDDDSDNSIDSFLKRTTAAPAYGSDSRDNPDLQQKQTMTRNSTSSVPQKMLEFNQLFEEPNIRRKTKTGIRKRRKKRTTEQENQGKSMVLNGLMTMLQAISVDPLQTATDQDEMQEFFEEGTPNDNEEDLVNGFDGFSDGDDDEGE